MTKATIKTIVIYLDNLASIKSGERRKAMYENKGYILVKESATPFRATLIYKNT